MEKEFYYLDEKEQKGPFTIDQLKTIGLKPETLVWSEGFENWKQVKDVDELKIVLKKTPPPPPIIDTISSTSTNVDNIKISNEKTNNVVDSNIKFWATFKIFGSILCFILLAIFISFYIVNSKKSKLKDEISLKINNVLDNKSLIIDGTISLTEGKLKNTGYGTKKQKNNDDPFSGIFKEWWENEKLHTIYTAESGGFTIKQLTKQSDESFDVLTSYSGDMGYKKPSSSYIAPQYIDDGWGGKFKISGGYQTSNYRTSVRDAYRSAYEYFTKEDKKSPGAYSPGKFIEITNFPDLRNEYFYFENREPKLYSSSGTFAATWESSGDHGANINNENWVVYYKTYGKHYELTENDSKINKDLLTNIGILLGLIFLILAIIFISKPKYFRNLNLFGKRWQNLLYKEQIFFFEHSFFGKQTFTEVINDKVYKGTLKITDKGNTLNLSYPNKELFYKIDKIDADNLSLISIKDKSVVTLKRIGAKEKVVTNSEISNEENSNADKNDEII